ncbi:hypothetical protein BJ170DRAFT_589244 [Xylariales sp. AK1849]|nr:hypothetical protein BJ170DRAFT_589244 [Xylariales sp. AK1849]
MKAQTILSTLPVGLLPALASAGACDCNNNNDAGRWHDKDAPADAAKSLNLSVTDGQLATACYTADVQGTMCLFASNNYDLVCLLNYAYDQQSWHGNWFLWSEIRCNAGARLTIEV